MWRTPSWRIWWLSAAWLRLFVPFAASWPLLRCLLSCSAGFYLFLKFPRQNRIPKCRPSLLDKILSTRPSFLSSGPARYRCSDAVVVHSPIHSFVHSFNKYSLSPCKDGCVGDERQGTCASEISESCCTRWSLLLAPVHVCV